MRRDDHRRGVRVFAVLRLGALVGPALLGSACMPDSETTTPATPAAPAATASDAVTSIAPFLSGTITGTATFTKAPTGVSISVALDQCPTGTHGIHIHAGTSCADAPSQGAHWGPTRGEGIDGTGTITCDTSMKGMLTYTRSNTDATTMWTIGDGAESDVLGHPIVVHGLVSTAREACGIIGRPR